MIHDNNDSLKDTVLAEAGPATSQFSAEPENRLPSSNASFVSPEAVKPFRRLGPEHQVRGRAKGKSQILTDTPEKAQIEGFTV